MVQEHTRIIENSIRESLAAKQALLEDRKLVGLIVRVGHLCVSALRRGHRLLLFGNGGSAADAQHIAAELVGRFRRERPGLPALALTTNTSALTAIGNDYAFESVFARQVDALGSRGDVAIGISTSGNAANVRWGITAAKAKGLVTVGLAGKSGGALKQLARYCLCVPSEATPRIQEVHILIGHILCEIIESQLFARTIKTGTAQAPRKSKAARAVRNLAR
jgi:D-sedoheptulose 7-phosphate isomerase